MLNCVAPPPSARICAGRSEEHTSELQSQSNIVCRLLLEQKSEEVAPGVPSILSLEPLQPIVPTTRSTGRRLPLMLSLQPHAATPTALLFANSVCSSPFRTG